MRVGIDASNLRSGGAIRHLAQMLSAGVPARHGIDRICVWGSPSLLSQLPEQKWLAKYPLPIGETCLAPRLVWQMLYLPVVSGRSCDLLFAPGGLLGEGVRCGVAMFQNMLPFDPVECRRYGLSKYRIRLRILRTLLTRSFQHSTGIVFLTEFARNLLRRKIANMPPNTIVAPHGVSEEFFREIPSQKSISQYSTEKPFRLLCVSNVDLYKHQWKLVEVCARLKKRGFPIRLEMVGAGYGPVLTSLRGALNRFDPESLFTDYRGPLAPAQMPNAYFSADAFIFASTCENLPNVLLEAMASALPIACSNRGPMEEVTAQAAIYFDPEELPEIERALEQLMLDVELRQHLSRKARARAAEFTWESCASKILQFLADLSPAALKRAEFGLAQP